MIHPDVARGLALENEARARDVLAERARLSARITHLENTLREIAGTYDETPQTPTKLCAALYAVCKIAAHALK